MAEAAEEEEIQFLRTVSPTMLMVSILKGCLLMNRSCNVFNVDSKMVEPFRSGPPNFLE
jgi:hypothetical protein